jgi:hypothetical protein
MTFRFLIVCLLSVLAPLPACACSVPVFRYALERWAADPLPVVVLHDKALSGEQEKLIERIRNTRFANARVVLVDVAKGAEAQFTRDTRIPLPQIVVNYAEGNKPDAPAWIAPLDTESVAALLDSPLRQEAGRRILAGQSAVWVLLECGDVKKDDQAARLLEAELSRMPRELKLPVPEDAVAEEILAGSKRPAPRIEFSLLRLSRRDAAERAFVSMLLNTEDDLKNYDEPMAFPIFGRGRALEGLIGKGITAENIKSSCAFLIGDCSCEVKRINPGRDMLMAVDWDQGSPLLPETPTELRRVNRLKKSQAPVATVSEVKEDLPPTEEELAPVESTPPRSRLILYALGLVGAAFLVLIARILR